jgi:hypothetical protein
VTTPAITTPTMPALARWIPDAIPAINALIARRAMCDVGIMELTTNRSPVIDGYMDAVGSPRGMSWCAASASAWFREMGAEIPPSEAGAVIAWKQWGFRTSRWTSRPAIGRAVIYGDAQDNPEHMGVLVRVAPALLSVEGNTSLAGYSTNGVGCFCKAATLARVLGYVNPLPLNRDEM